MVRFVLGVIFATIAAYAFGFLYWGVLTLPYEVGWKQTRDDEAAGKALLEHFPQRGTYFVPGKTHDPARHEKLSKQGPTAMVHMITREGRPVFDPMMMAEGFALDLVSVVLLAALMSFAAKGLPTYGSRVTLIALAALAAVVFVDGGDLVWWRLPLEWKLVQALYTFSTWFVAGILLAIFIKPAWTPVTILGAKVT